LVDVPPAHDDLLDGAGRHAPRRDRLAVLPHHVLHERRVRRVLPEAEGLREPGAAAEPAREEPRAAPRRVALDVLEEERGALLLEDAAGDGSELTVPVHLGRDPAQLALLLEPRDPPAQVRERHQATRVRRAPRVFAGSRVPGVGPRNVAAYGEAPRATSHSASGPARPRGATKSSVCDPTAKRTPAPSISGRSRSRPGRRRTSAYQRATGGTSRLERRPPLVGGIVLVERDQLHVRAVAERDERVVGADGMATAGHDGEAERRVALPGGREVGNRDDNVVDASEHQRPPNAGATSP